MRIDFTAQGSEQFNESGVYRQNTHIVQNQYYHMFRISVVNE